MNLDTFLSQCGLTKHQARDGLQLRTLGSPDSGTAADVECFDRAGRSIITVTVWEWSRGTGGVSRQRVGRLEFDIEQGELLSPDQSDPAAMAQMIIGMERLVE